MSDLSKKEQDVYELITQTIKNEGYSPSIRDIKETLNIKSTSSVHGYLEKLEKKGYIKREAKKSRTVRLDDAVGTENIEVKQFVKVPIVGRIRAGMPILATENYDGYLNIPVYRKSYLSLKLFALRVVGDSMIEAGILEEDIIIVEKRNTADEGDIIVALLEDEATVKKYYIENGYVRLQPCNSQMRPIIVSDVTILGRVISVMRFY